MFKKLKNSLKTEKNGTKMATTTRDREEIYEYACPPVSEIIYTYPSERSETKTKLTASKDGGRILEAASEKSHGENRTSAKRIQSCSHQIAKNVNPIEIIHRLLFIEDRDKICAVARTDPRSAVHEIIKEVLGKGKEEEFIDTLKACGYKRLVHFIRNYENMDQEFHKMRLQSVCHRLREMISVPEVLPYLVKEDMISKEDSQYIFQKMQQEGEIAAADVMLDKITRRHMMWYFKLIECFENSRHGVVADILYREIQKEGPSPQTMYSQRKDDKHSETSNIEMYEDDSEGNSESSEPAPALPPRNYYRCSETSSSEISVNVVEGTIESSQQATPDLLQRKDDGCSETFSFEIYEEILEDDSESSLSTPPALPPRKDEGCSASSASEMYKDILEDKRESSKSTPPALPPRKERPSSPPVNTQRRGNIKHSDDDRINSVDAEIQSLQVQILYMKKFRKKIEHRNKLRAILEREKEICNALLKVFDKEEAHHAETCTHETRVQQLKFQHTHCHERFMPSNALSLFDLNAGRWPVLFRLILSPSWKIIA